MLILALERFKWSKSLLLRLSPPNKKSPQQNVTFYATWKTLVICPVQSRSLYADLICMSILLF